MSDMAHLFRTITLGVYVIAVDHGRNRDAFTAASVAQISYSPLLLALAINPQHASYGLLSASKAWTISVLGSGQIAEARHFGTHSLREGDKMQHVRWASAPSGLPFLEDALAYFDCRLVAEYEGGDHRIALGRVIGGAVLASGPKAKPLLYTDTGDLDGSAALYPNGFE
jgi:flavin reductase (DIM6/NTAB) family NADH-FMN oxidoreductase RutF